MKVNPKLTADDIIAQAYARRQAKKDPALHNYQAPLGYHLRGVSTLINKDGNVTQTWVKTQKSLEDPQAILDAFQVAMAERDIKVAPEIKLVEKDHNEDLLATYVIGDAHIGMLAWKDEAGEDFDLKIAEETLVAAINKLVGLAPASEQALLINLGDFFHADNNAARTEQSGAQLDVDSRWAKVMRIGINIMIQCINCALEKHKKVTLINSIGNHDNYSSSMLSLCLAHHYQNNPRVFIDTAPTPFHWFEFGKCLLAVHHGHNVKPENLPLLMATDKKDAWARSTNTTRQWYLGHLHSLISREYPGCMVETFRTLAAKDAWHNSKGYRSGRELVCDIWHKEHGKLTRHIVGISQIIK